RWWCGVDHKAGSSAVGVARVEAVVGGACPGAFEPENPPQACASLSAARQDFEPIERRARWAHNRQSICVHPDLFASLGSSAEHDQSLSNFIPALIELGIRSKGAFNLPDPQVTLFIIKVGGRGVAGL